MTFTYTQHALTMLDERMIERLWVERTILEPEMIEPDPRYDAVIRAYRRVPERDDRVLRVVYVLSGSTHRVITLFLDRGRRQ